MAAIRSNPSRGFTLIEVTVSIVLAAILMTALFRLWGDNQSASLRIGNKADFRDKASLATTALNRAITRAGFGLSNLDVIKRQAGDSSDILILYHNPDERRTTLRDTAKSGYNKVVVFNDTGFAVGGMLGITDSLKHEFAEIASISGDSASGWEITLASPLQYRYDPGVPDIYPAVKETFFINKYSHALVSLSEGTQKVLAHGITDFSVELKDGSGYPATSYKDIRVVTFALAGTYKAPEGTFNQMRFSTTVIPRNIL